MEECITEGMVLLARTQSIVWYCAKMGLVLTSEREDLFTVEFPCECHVVTGDTTDTYLILLGAVTMQDHTEMVHGQLPGACERRVDHRVFEDDRRVPTIKHGSQFVSRKLF